MADKSRPFIAGDVIEFLDEVSDLDAYPEPGMRARVRRIAEKWGDITVVEVDYSEFDEFNASLESSQYYDKMGQPVLTAREAGHYIPTESIYVDSESGLGRYAKLLSSVSLEVWRVYGSTGLDDLPSYIRWLESIVHSALNPMMGHEE